MYPKYTSTPSVSGLPRGVHGPIVEAIIEILDDLGDCYAINRTARGKNQLRLSINLDLSITKYQNRLAKPYTCPLAKGAMAMYSTSKQAEGSPHVTLDRFYEYLDLLPANAMRTGPLNNQVRILCQAGLSVSIEIPPRERYQILSFVQSRWGWISPSRVDTSEQGNDRHIYYIAVGPQFYTLDLLFSTHVKLLNYTLDLTTTLFLPCVYSISAILFVLRGILETVK